MARNKSPQTFEKRRRERNKQMKRDEKFERRLERNAEKKRLKAEGIEPGQHYVEQSDEYGEYRQVEMPADEGPPTVDEGAPPVDEGSPPVDGGSPPKREGGDEPAEKDA